MIEVKIKRQSKDKMDKHLQSHSPAQLSTKRYHSLFLFWQFYFLSSTVCPIFGRRSHVRLFDFKFKSEGSHTFTFYSSALWTAIQVPLNTAASWSDVTFRVRTLRHESYKHHYCA